AAREHYSAAWRTYGLSSFGASVNLNPAHQVAQLLTSLLDRVIIVGSTQTLEFLVATLNISQQTLGEGAVLDISQDVLHALLGTSIDNAWAGDVATELSGVRYRVVHVADAALEHEVNNQLELVQNLEVRHLWLVASFGQNLKTGLDQFLGATAQNCLLTEEVSDGLCLEGRWDNACACAAQSSRVRRPDQRRTTASCHGPHPWGPDQLRSSKERPCRQRIDDELSGLGPLAQPCRR